MRKTFLSGIALLIAAFSAYSQELVVLHFNDTHSHLEPVRSGEEAGHGGVIERAAYVDSVRTAVGRRNVLLLHAGDFSQGTSYFTLLKGDVEIDLINAMKYDAVTLGNHEFDNGLDELARRLKFLKCPVVCANYDFSLFELGRYVKPYVIVRKAGMKIGIFGLLTDITTVVDRTIADRIPKLDDVETANKWADYLKNTEKCDMVVALTHLGFSGEKFTDPDLVKATRNIDLVVGGHSHTFLKEVVYVRNLDGTPVPIVQNGCWGIQTACLRVTRK
ncbi:MAG: bifunctional metallophosphatase/5'-nucleotidase [Candidatus Cryptobacteroides sp.]|nr:metallophosphoesterase [Bacteroidales bacterium]